MEIGIGEDGLKGDVGSLKVALALLEAYRKALLATLMEWSEPAVAELPEDRA